jgi:hypothetical protein
LQAPIDGRACSADGGRRSADGGRRKKEVLTSAASNYYSRNRN